MKKLFRVQKITNFSYRYQATYCTIAKNQEQHFAYGKCSLRTNSLCNALCETLTSLQGKKSTTWIYEIIRNKSLYFTQAHSAAHFATIQWNTNTIAAKTKWIKKLGYFIATHKYFKLRVCFKIDCEALALWVWVFSSIFFILFLIF